MMPRAKSAEKSKANVSAVKAMESSPAIGELERGLGHRFADSDLLRIALTHASAVTRQSPKRKRGKAIVDADNQRLEFLGDRVLGLVIAEMLFKVFPGENEGALAKRLAALVRQGGLARVARQLDLGRYLALSRGEEESGGRDNEAILADACEAVIGALYLDGGLEVARGLIEAHWQAMMSADQQPPQDAKTALQEWAQASGFPLPIYRVVKSDGPPHDPVFEIAVSVKGHDAAHASGRSKRQAEQAAAARLMARLRLS